MKAAVTGAGGFIGGHLLARLARERGSADTIVGIDMKPHHEWWQKPEGAITFRADLRYITSAAMKAFEGADFVYHLACDMGGRGFIETHERECAMNALLDLSVLEACRQAGVKRFFYASTACVYHCGLQTAEVDIPLAESMVQVAGGVNPDGMYGFAKLYGEAACATFSPDMDIRIGRFHGVYGPHGDWTGGKEKAPAAIMRKVADAMYDGRSIPVWGDGTARRSFMHVDDAVEGMLRLMRSNCGQAINLGSEEVVTVDELVQTAAGVAGLSVINIVREDGPVGVHGRSSDNTMIRRELGWAPSISLDEGVRRTFPWVAEQVEKARV